MIEQPLTRDEFENWFNTTYPHYFHVKDLYNEFPFAMSIGLYQEYFASVGLPIWIKPFDNEWQGNVAHLMRTRFDTYEVVHQLALNAAADLREGQLG